MKYHEMLGGLKLSDAFPLKFHMVLDWSTLSQAFAELADALA